MMGGTAPKLRVELARPEDFLARVLPNGRLGSLAFDGVPPAPVGRTVRLVVEVREPTVRVFNVRVRVAWATHKPTAAFGVEFIQEDLGGRARLLAFASNNIPPSAFRREERISVALSVVVRQGRRASNEALVDLSYGGAFVRTKEPLAPGTEVELSLRPPLSLSRIKLPGRVAWVRNGTQAGMGVTFGDLDPRQILRLGALMAKLRQD